MINKFLEYLVSCFRIIPTSISVWMLIVFGMGVGLLLAFGGLKKGVKWTSGLLLIEYLFFLLFWAVLARENRGHRAIIVTPFWSYRAIREGKDLLVEIIANVLAFIPMGLLLGCTRRSIKWWTVLLIGLAFSLLIETLQFVLKRGFFEFDDVFHNVMGCMIGWGLYLAFAHLIKKVLKK